MGTSRSSTGPRSNVPLIPPWVPDSIPPADGDGPDNPDTQNGQDPQTQLIPPQQFKPIPLAPARRFGPARASLGSFARTGSLDNMRRGVGHYIHKGYGGADFATRRMGGTSRTAGTLYDALSAAAAGRAVMYGSPFDPVILTGRSANEVMDALIEAVRPTDGTQDTEASQSAIRYAMSELLTHFPNANLLDLSEEQRLFAIEGFIARDVYNRFYLDLGKAIQEKAPSVMAALSRLKDVQDYVKQTVSARFRDLVKAGEKLGAQRISELTRQALHAAFQVFEDYVR